MIVIRHNGGELPFHKKYLKEIIIDNPGIKTNNGKELFIMAYGALKAAMMEGGIKSVQIRLRSCDTDYKCKQFYKQDLEKQKLIIYII
ncbi:MAG: hypothetical protein HQK83_04505 [Fibrobacteria bacterium]|nr:hypothetical protein [Fibrobacteria bacterium]